MYSCFIIQNIIKKKNTKYSILQPFFYFSAIDLLVGYRFDDVRRRHVDTVFIYVHSLSSVRSPQYCVHNNVVVTDRGANRFSSLILPPRVASDRTLHVFQLIPTDWVSTEHAAGTSPSFPSPPPSLRRPPRLPIPSPPHVAFETTFFSPFDDPPSPSPCGQYYKKARDPVRYTLSHKRCV